MSDALHMIRVKRQEAFAVFLRERLIHEMANVLVEGWPAFMKVGSYLYRPEDLAQENKQDGYLLSVLVRVMADQDPGSDQFTALGDPAGRDNRHLLRDIRRGLNQINPDLRKRFDRLKNHLEGLSKAIQALDDSQATKSQHRKRDALIAQRENIYESAYERAVSIKKRKDASFAPKTLVLQGGGAKAIGFSGVAEALQRNGTLSDIRYVAGTSAGALMGLPIALGYKAEEIKEIVQKGRFAQFFAEATLPVGLFEKYKDRLRDTTKVKWAKLWGRNHLISSDPHASPHVEAYVLQDFSRAYFLPTLVELSGLSFSHLMSAPEDQLMREFRVLEKSGSAAGANLEAICAHARLRFMTDMKRKGMGTEAEILQFPALFGRSEALQCAIQCVRFAKSKINPEVETIEEFIGDIVQYRLDKLRVEDLVSIVPPLTTREQKRNITFSQLKQLAERLPGEGFKEFGVAITDHYMPLTPSGVIRMCARAVRKVNEAWINKQPVEPGLGLKDDRFFFRPIVARAAGDDGRHGELADMPIKKAVRASMNLPGLFETIKHQGLYMIDGGVCNNMPLGLFADKFASPKESDEQTIGFILSPLESDLEFQGVDDLIQNADGKLSIILDDEIREQMRAFEINHLKSLGSLGSNNLSKLWQKITGALTSAMSLTVRNIMAYHNVTPLTEDSLNNIGVVHSGDIATADFHLSLQARQALHMAGEIAALNLLGVHQDRHYRYAICRLRSLTLQERLLSQKLGIETPLPGLLDTYQNTRTLRAALDDAHLDTWSLGEVLQGRV